jgi:hypothetical protein
MIAALDSAADSGVLAAAGPTGAMVVGAELVGSADPAPEATADPLCGGRNVHHAG